jgi:hypothetical protein
MADVNNDKLTEDLQVSHPEKNLADTDQYTNQQKNDMSSSRQSGTPKDSLKASEAR